LYFVVLYVYDFVVKKKFTFAISFADELIVIVILTSCVGQGYVCVSVCVASASEVTPYCHAAACYEMF